MKDINSDSANIISKHFELAVRMVKSLPQKGSFQPSYSEAAKIYSYFKQSKFGPCNIPKPGFWDYINRAKWEAWAALGDMSQTDAMQKYVEEIKYIYIRIKDIQEFQENEHVYAEDLIPFCQANNIPMSAKLNEIVRKKMPVEKTEKENDRMDNNIMIINGNDKLNPTFPMNGNGINVVEMTNNGNDVDHLVTDDDLEIEVTSNANDDGIDHSLLVENSIAATAKSVSFVDLNNSNSDNVEDIKETNLKNNEINIEEEDKEEDEEEEIFCDPENGSSTLFEITNLTESSSLTDTSTPYVLKNIKNEDKSTSSETSNSFEILPTQNGNSVRKKTTASSESSESCNVLNELKKPYKRSDKKSFSKRDTYKKTNGRHHALRDHKRLDNQSNEKNGAGHSRNDHHRSGSTHQNPDSNPSHHNPLQQQTFGDQGEGSDGDEEGSSSSASSLSNDTVGFKIVNSLERMEENMLLVLDRLDSIEETIKVISKSSTPWWKGYIPSKSVLVWTAWPILVNFLFFLYWRRMTRHKFKKC